MTDPITLPAFDADELTHYDVGAGFDDWTVAADEHIEDRRWYALYRLVIRRDSDGQHFAANYKVGLTEEQEDIKPFEGDTVTFVPVVARTRMVEVTEYVVEEVR